jgi:hypothetical protein
VGTRGRVGRPGERERNIAEVLCEQGHLEEAEELAVEALRVHRSTGYRFVIAWVTSLLGRIAARSGRFDDAHAALDDARSAFVASGLPGDVIRTDAWRAEVLLMEGDAAAALALATETKTGSLKEGGVPPELPLLERVRCLALVALGQDGEARNALHAAIEAAQARDADYDYALALDVQLGVPEWVPGDEDRITLTKSRDAILERLGVVYDAVTFGAREDRPTRRR